MTKKTFDTPLPPAFARSIIASGAAKLYAAVVAVRNSTYEKYRNRTHKVSLPVISIGGIRAGGSGKTPAAMLLIDICESLGVPVGLLSRGYRRVSKKPVIVSPCEKAPWEVVGDEPAMIRGAFPATWLGIGADRLSNAKKMCAKLDKRGILLLDDGFQHRKLHRDADIVCIHEQVLTDRMLPQGYLREPVSSLSRAQVLFIITSRGRHEKATELKVQLDTMFPSTDTYVLVNEVQGWVNAESGQMLAKVPLASPVAVSGIARPERFFELIAAQGVSCSMQFAFPDHYIFRESDITALRKLYSQGFITTEKDVMRLTGRGGVPGACVWYLKMRLSWLEKDSLSRFKRYIMGIINLSKT